MSSLSTIASNGIFPKNMPHTCYESKSDGCVHFEELTPVLRKCFYPNEGDTGFHRRDNSLVNHVIEYLGKEEELFGYTIYPQETGIPYVMKVAILKAATLRSDSVVFGHGQPLRQAFFTDLISELMQSSETFWGRRELSFRVPSTATYPQTVVALFNQRQKYSLNDNFSQGHINLISVDVEFVNNKTPSESAFSFFQRKLHLERSPMDIRITQQIVEFFFKDQCDDAKQQWAKEILDCRKEIFKNLPNPSGRITLIAVKKTTIANPNVNFIYRSHESGNVCEEYEEKQNLGLTLVNGQMPPCGCFVTGRDHLQARIIASGLMNKEARSDTQYFTYDTMTQAERIQYEFGVKNLAARIKGTIFSGSTEIDSKRKPGC